MKLLPAPACNFVIADRVKKYPAIETIRYMIWYQRHHHDNIHPLLGSFDGNVMKDADFQKKISKIQTKLERLNIPYFITHYNLHEAELAESRRLSQEEKRKRKHSKLMNAYEAKKKTITESSDLFKVDKLEDLEKELEIALKRLSTIYLL